MAEPGLFLRLFSTPEIRALGSETPLLPVGKPLALFAFLAVENRPVSRDELAALLWPGTDPLRGKASVRQALWNIRKALDTNPFATDEPLTLRLHSVETDLARFREALDIDNLETARGLWIGPLLEGLEFPRNAAWSHWLDQIRTREEQRFGAALATAAEKARSLGTLTLASSLFETAVAILPESATLHVALVETLLESRAYREAEEAMAVARRALEESEDPRILEELEARLTALRVDEAVGTDLHGLHTEFVGRTTEFSRLATSWRLAKQERPRLALVLGAAGLGKTRLAMEMAALVRSESCGTVAAKAVAVERGLRWGTASDMMRSLHALPGAAGISNRSASVLSRLVPSLGVLGSDTRHTAPGAVEAAAVSDALLDLVGAVAEEGPLLLIVDDLQWVDRESRAALSHLVRNLKRGPVLFLITCRTEERDPEVAKAVESLLRTDERLKIELAPLGSPEVSELLALLVEDVEPEDLDALGQHIHGITQGNPLFIVETLKLLQGEGLIRPVGNGKWKIAQACIDGQLPVPETVELAILRRLEDLGNHAELLVIHLAGEARPIPSEELRRRSGLGPFPFSDGMSELFDRDLVRRDAHDRILFVHDAVTEVARRRLDSPRWAREAMDFANRRRSRRWIPWGFGGAAVAAFALAGASGIGPMSFLRNAGGSDPLAGETYPYGRGRIFVDVLESETAYWLQAPSHIGEDWQVKDTVLGFNHPSLFGPFRLPSDSLLFFALDAENSEAPPHVGTILADGSVDPIWKTQGDAGFKDLSPDGQTVLVFQENPAAEDYAHDLLAVDRDTRRARVLFRANERIRSASWSPDGLRIALIGREKQDTIHIIDPSGERHRSFGIDGVFDLSRLAWCDDSDRIVFSGVVENQPILGMVQSTTGRTVMADAEVGLHADPICLGDGLAIAYPGALNGDIAYLAMDVASGEHTPLFVRSGSPALIRGHWVPDTVDPVIKGVTIEPREPQVDWGGKVPLSAMGFLSDGTTRPVPVTWEALDPNRASVDATGMVTGHEAGSSSLVARFGGWITDTARVTVLAWERPGVVLHGDFQARELARWQEFGSSPARTVNADGETVLSLEGDGRYRDGLSSKETFSLEDGARVEVVFRLPLNQSDRQRIEFCIQPESVPGPAGERAFLGSSTHLAYCLKYPAREQVKFDPFELEAYYGRGGSVDWVRLPAEVDTSDWTQFALEIQPDGQVALYVNQRLVRALENPIFIDPETRWRIQLAGAAENTQLLVRSLTVYSGEG